MSTVLAIPAYLKIFVGLLILTALTVGVAFLDLGALGTPIALTIASTKALLVILYFMHVRYSSKLTWVIAAAGFFWLLILFLFSFSDYASRVPVLLPGS